MADDALVTMAEDDVNVLKSYVDRLSPEKRQRISNGLKHIKTGLYAVAPITCPGPRKCPFITHCPIPDLNQNGTQHFGPDSDYPIGMSCILEGAYMKQKTADYITFLKVDSANPVEMGLVNELALIDLYKNRAAMILSSGDKSGQGMDFLRIDTSSSDNGNGEAATTVISTTTQLHPALMLIDQLEKRREKLLTQLIQTRKSQTEIAIKMGKKKDESQLIDELRKVRELLGSQQLELQQLSMKEDVMPLKD